MDRKGETSTMSKLLIWDFNGTIIDDLDICLSIENKMLKDRNMKYGYTVEDYRNLFCFPVKDYYKKLGYTFENESYQTVSDEFNEEYDALFKNVKLTDGFLDKIHESIDKGYTNVILSATEQNTLEKQVKELGIDSYFEELIGIDDNMAFSKVEHAKRWMKDKNIDSSECTYIGDTLHDLETIQALNISKYYLVSIGHQSYEVLLKEAKDHVVHSLRDINL